MRLDEHGRLLDEIPCVHCGYNLRGQSLERVCSECGTPVGRSVRGDLLAYSDPLWVRQLSRGMNYVVAMIVATLLLAVAGLVVRALPSGNVDMDMIGMIVLGLLAETMGVVGYWLVTTPDPTHTGQVQGLSARILARATAVARYMIALVMAAVSLAALGGATLGATSTILQAVGVVDAILGVVFTFAFLIYLRSLALRILNRSLAEQTRVVMWGLAMCFGLVLLSGLLLLGAAPTRAWPAAVPMCVAGVGFVVFGLWALVLILSYRSQFQKAADHALSTWAAEQGPAAGGA